jgi:hypothetical protein
MGCAPLRSGRRCSWRRGGLVGVLSCHVARVDVVDVAVHGDPFRWATRSSISVSASRRWTGFESCPIWFRAPSEGSESGPGTTFSGPWSDPPERRDPCNDRDLTASRWFESRPARSTGTQSDTLDEDTIDDDTGAGDMFAAGYLLARLDVRLSEEDGERIGMELARTKLLTDRLPSGGLVRELLDRRLDQQCSKAMVAPDTRRVGGRSPERPSHPVCLEHRPEQRRRFCFVAHPRRT